MKHNRRWFRNKMGQKIFCNDHEDKMGKECEGIKLKDESQIENFIKNQKRGIDFY